MRLSVRPDVRIILSLRFSRVVGSAPDTSKHNVLCRLLSPYRRLTRFQGQLHKWFVCLALFYGAIRRRRSLPPPPPKRRQRQRPTAARDTCTLFFQPSKRKENSSQGSRQRLGVHSCCHTRRQGPARTVAPGNCFSGNADCLCPSLARIHILIQEC